jgi:hypothetical protein
MEYVYHIVAIRVNETSWAHVWRLHSRYLGTGYDMVYARITESEMGGERGGLLFRSTRHKRGSLEFNGKLL